MVFTHRCRSCCLSAERTSGGSRTPAPCPCHHMCAGNRRFHSYKSLRTRHTFKSYIHLVQYMQHEAHDIQKKHSVLTARDMEIVLHMKSRRGMKDGEYEGETEAERKG